MGTYSVETPESVEVSFELAGPGSRFCGLLIDMLLMWLVVFIVGIVAMCAGAPFIEAVDSQVDDEFGAWMLAVVLVIVMLVLFGYYAIFELLLNGQTPGKRYLQIRVMRDDGTPATALDIVIRNLVRIVDALPGVYVVGGMTALLHPQSKRLGDIVAGTIVVKESEPDFRAAQDHKHGPRPVEIQVTYAALDAEERRLVRGFLQRRIQLLPDAREHLAQGLAQRLHARHGGDISDPEAYLESIAEGRHLDA
jgi:uncharacterized RDD family membrane protein YckC